MPKMAKITKTDTLFMTKTTKKTIPLQLGDTHTNIAHKIKQVTVPSESKSK